MLFIPQLSKLIWPLALLIVSMKADHFFGEFARPEIYHCFNNNNVNLDSWKVSELILLGNQGLGVKDDTSHYGA